MAHLAQGDEMEGVVEPAVAKTTPPVHDDVMSRSSSMTLWLDSSIPGPRQRRSQRRSQYPCGLPVATEPATTIDKYDVSRISSVVGMRRTARIADGPLPETV